MISTFTGDCGVDHTVEVSDAGRDWVSFAVSCPTTRNTIVRFAPKEVFDAEPARLLALTEEQLKSACSPYRGGPAGLQDPMGAHA